MRKLVLVVMLVTVAFLAGRFWQDLFVHASNGGGAGNSPVGNGDVNGDGGIDISDASYLLNFLFLGGPALLPCPGGGAGSGLPDTGQTQCVTCSGEPCFDCTGRPKPCEPFPEEFLTLQDSLQPTGCPNDASRFTVAVNPNSEDTVIDNCTGLEWQRFTADPDGDGTANGFTWCEALGYCFASNYAGHNDWRLPSVRELESIVDYGRFRPAIAPIFFVGEGGGDGGGAGVVHNQYWSSTSDADNPGAWVVVFDEGFTDRGFSKASRFFVRAVRGGQ